MSDRTKDPRMYVRWVLTVYEAGSVVSRGYHHTEQMAKDEMQKRQDQHIGVIRGYEIKRQEIEL